VISASTFALLSILVFHSKKEFTFN
jgi:hypothetical protein